MTASGTVRTSLDDSPSLPDGWRWAEVRDLCRSIDYGFTASADFKLKEPRFLRITDIQNSRVEWTDVPGCRIGAKDEAANSLADGDVVFARSGATSGKSFLVQNPPRSVFASYLIRLRVGQHISPQYLWSFFQSEAYWQQIRDSSRGGAQPNVNATLLGKIRVPLPPYSEQRRIVDILDEQMAAIDRARAAAQARLDAAQALPAAFLLAIFDSAEMQRWPLQPLGKVLRLRKDVVHPHDNPKGAATFVGLEHIETLTGKRTGMLDVEMSTLTGRKPRFFKGDIVYGYLRPYLNKLWIAEFDGLCSVDQYVYEVDSSVNDSRFVAYFMRSPIYLQRAPIDTTPGQLPRIRTEEVASVEINLPDYDTQKHIADLIDSKMEDAARLRRTLEHQASAINALPSALLRRAFTGGL